MGIFREIPPTAGYPFFGRDLLSLLSGSLDNSGLEEDFCAYLKVPFARVTYSGTAALYIILEALKELSSRKTVVIPAYICPLVALAVQRAGLKPEVCDIAEDNFGFQPQELDAICSRKDILAIIPCHLGGLVPEFSIIEDIAKKHDIFIIEDCAQSLGAEYHGRKTGTLGDFSFFSLCRGKGLTIYEGGVAVSRSKQYCGLLENKFKQIAKKDYFSETEKLMELCGYWLFYRRQLFWFVFRLPQLFWNLQGKTVKAFGEEFSIDFPVHRVSRLRNRLGHMSFHRLTEQVQKQRQKAQYYLQRLKNISGIKALAENQDTSATYPYLTVLFDDAGKKERVLKALKGDGASVIYSRSITDYDYLKEISSGRIFLHARLLAQRHLTLSTSIFLSRKDQDRIIDKIKSCP